jgi:DNA-binding phage protein
MKDRSHDEATAELFASDKQLAVQILNDSLNESDVTVLSVTIRQLVSSAGGTKHISQLAAIREADIEAAIKPEACGTLVDLRKALEEVGMRLTVELT